MAAFVVGRAEKKSSLSALLDFYCHSPLLSPPDPTPFRLPLVTRARTKTAPPPPTTGQPASQPGTARSATERARHTPRLNPMFDFFPVHTLLGRKPPTSSSEERRGEERRALFACE